MHINLPDRIATEALSGELAAVIEALTENGVASVAEIRITLRAFNEDDREIYAADERGHHYMGFTIRHPPQIGPNNLREMSWTFKEPRPQPKPLAPGEPRGLQSLLGRAPRER
jgi:hypothetical protein